MYFTPVRYPYQPLPADMEQDVLVAGAGPVGLATALGLARRGIKVTVLEAEDSVCFGSRAICLSRHSLEVLNRLGEPGQRLASKALAWTTGRSYLRDTQVLKFEMPHAATDPSPPMVNISQSQAGQILVDAALAQPGLTIAWKHKVRSASQDEEAATATVATPDGQRELSARWLVAADGARSKVRGALRLYLHGTSYAGYYVIADIHWKAGLATERRLWFDPPAAPGQTILLHRQPDDIWRFDCQLPPEADAEREMQPDRVRERIASHLDWIGNTRPWTLEWSSVYCARALSLDDYVHGRVIFAGDAAHQIPIFGVRGLNCGFEDADTLSWMLAAVTTGAAGPQLLRAYGRERRDAWQQNVTQADLSTVFMSPPTDGYRAARDAVLDLAKAEPALQELINPRQTTASHVRSSPLSIPLPAGAPAVPVLPGDPVPDVAVVAPGGRAGSLHAERGASFTLLGFAAGDAAQLARAAAGLAERLGPALGAAAIIVTSDPPGPAGPQPAAGGVTVVTDAVPGGPGGGQLAAQLGAGPGEVLVIRPDGVLLGRWPAQQLPEPAALAAHVRDGGSTVHDDGAAAGTELADTEQPGGTEGDAAGQQDPGGSPAEQSWRALSNALDVVPADGREAFLTRLALVLSLRQPGPSAMADAIAAARPARKASSGGPPSR